MTTRRAVLTLLAHACAACAAPMSPARDGRGLVARVPHPPVTTVEPGEHVLGLEPERDGLLFVPGTYHPATPAPLLVMLHGASGSAARMRFLFEAAGGHGIIVLAPESRDRRTWDAIQGSFGPDIAFIERALDFTFDRCAVAAKRLAIGGFSDGASYALSAGLASGDLFTHICAFSPGFITPATRRGRPDVFISHGTGDNVLPIEDTSRRIVPRLRAGGYRVTYKEFDGGHRVPPDVVRDAFQWLARG